MQLCCQGDGQLIKRSACAGESKLRLIVGVSWCEATTSGRKGSTSCCRVGSGVSSSAQWEEKCGGDESGGGK